MPAQNKPDSQISAPATTNRPSRTLTKLRRKIPTPQFIHRLIALRKIREHKSFKLTRRRDIPKRPRLPGYFAFTATVVRTIGRQWRVFGPLLVVYVVLSFVLIGASQQEQYRSITDALSDTKSTTGLDTVTQLGGIFGATLIGTLNSSLTEMQQYYLVGLYVFMWLIVVWLLRQLLAGNRITVRDGLYNAGAPLISSALIVLLMLLQAFPGTLGILLFVYATQTSAIAGVVAMVFGVIALLMVILSLYWLTASFFALIIVTLPGTYPMKAIRGGSDIVLGRRSSLLFRLGWLVIIALLVWSVLFIPALLIDFWVKVSWLPLVTIGVQVATGAALIFGASYVFLLYRRMLDEPAQ